MTPATMEQMKLGALVQLNSGGPAMVVTGWEANCSVEQELSKPTRNQPSALTEYDTDMITVFVAWTGDNGEPFSGQYSAACLKPH